MNKILKTITFTLLVNFFIPFNISAKELTKELNVSCNRPWSIEFNEKIDPSTLNGNIIITDSKGKQLKTSINLDDSKRIVIVTPEDKYDTHYMYTLSVNKNVKSDRGQSLQEETTKKFTIMNVKDYNIDAIKNEANESFKGANQCIDFSKSDWGLESYEKVADMYMDKGFEYYHFSPAILYEENPSLDNIYNIIYSTNQIIFFNKINGKNICSAIVQYSSENKWETVSVSSSNFYNDIITAEKKYSLKDGDFKLVYYEFGHIIGLLVTNSTEPYFINLVDNWVVKANKFEKVDIKKVAEDYRKYVKDEH
ncbi:hypothetical protein Ccar_24640 [Clostridium carboxidivorans P7]|uniref:SbsA Ig-like domain-containing protein n=1 Tax=Clostridium carboxidivorans P7 TaxID=536227 RepID=C6PU38_9CLOT|nr:Ig-like domain-containing protein [Clostridium carboxidivorans]AKN33843.1 hypothetical protein Ccar_24640 [Clostridium carboxidivorans P7]EET87238.1 hypothetical protein CcarbDRAFT_2305 [Clostridium carboxidivorans P7]EFG86544.1 hypothetical protein CLCAR_3491 [Clostridium carboxidivorans P7]